jgi:hypothetical protein
MPVVCCEHHNFPTIIIISMMSMMCLSEVRNSGGNEEAAFSIAAKVRPHYRWQFAHVLLQAFSKKEVCLPHVHRYIDDDPHTVQRQGPCISVANSGKCGAASRRSSAAQQEEACL